MCNAFETLGTPAVYPGHAITISLVILSIYGSPEAALKESEQVVSDTTLPGAGGNVYSALSFLDYICKGMPLDEAFEMADRWWAQCDDQKSFLPARWKAGQDQADSLKERLRAKLSGAKQE